LDTNRTFWLTVIGRLFDIIGSGFGPSAGQPIVIELVLITMPICSLIVMLSIMKTGAPIFDWRSRIAESLDLFLDEYIS